MTAPEGSDERRQARHLLISRAEQARRQGASFDGWREKTSPHLLELVSERDLDSIFRLVWQRAS